MRFIEFFEQIWPQCVLFTDFDWEIENIVKIGTLVSHIGWGEEDERRPVVLVKMKVDPTNVFEGDVARRFGQKRNWIRYNQLFYQSTGMNSGWYGYWFPFGGVDITHLIKKFTHPQTQQLNNVQPTRNVDNYARYNNRIGHDLYKDVGAAIERNVDVKEFENLPEFNLPMDQGEFRNAVVAASQ